MIIGIDGTVLGIPFESGQRRYTKNLIYNLAKIDKKNIYIIFGPQNINIPKSKNFRHVVWPKYFLFFRRQILLPILARVYKVDVFHYPDVWGSIIPPCKKTIVTFNDFAPDYAYPSWNKSLFYFAMKISNYFVRTYTLSYAKLIVLISNAIKKEYIKVFGEDKRIRVIYDGVGVEFKKITSNKGDYFLAFSDFSPRKNVIRVLEAYTIFIKRNPNIKINLKIIISTDYPRFSIVKKSEELGIGKNVEIIKAVSNKKLVNLFNRAVALVYPSLYEGFGLPILEAMACGCPVVTSDYGATKEISGSAAILINPKNVEDIYSAMFKLVTSTTLQKKYIKLGISRSKQFGWKKTAIETLKAYMSLHAN